MTDPAPEERRLTPTDREDVLYLKLKGARESLCLAQMHVTDDSERRALDKAVQAIDYVGSQLPQWSRFDRIEADGWAEVDAVLNQEDRRG